MKVVTVEGVLTVLTPLHHGGDEKTGTETLLRRVKYLVGDEMLEIPHVSGNAIRGMLRRLVIRDFLEKVGYEVKSPRLYHALYSGGVLETVAEKDVGKLDLEMRRKIRSLIVPVSLFGTSIMNQAFAGKLSVGPALPICRELKDYIPFNSEKSFYEFLDFLFSTRREEEEFKSTEERKKGEQAVQMIYRFEVFVPGTRLYHWFTLQDTNEVEEGCFLRTLELWQETPFLGGRSAIGAGKVKLEYAIPKEIGSVEKYKNFVEKHKEEILQVLGELDEQKV